MPTSFLGPYARTILAATLLALVLVFSYTDLRYNTWVELLPFFEWMEITWFGIIAKTWGASFAIVEAVHLLGLAVLGGTVLVSDGRLLGLGFTDVPARTIIDRTHRVFIWALVLLLVTGVFMACGVATKIYYLPVYWYKMLALVVGMLFALYIRKPLLAGDIDEINPWVVKAVAVSSILLWFTVAATGRWIGYTG